MLWFAWKIVLLQYRKQQHVGVQHSHRCCDLLEKSYFCSIANNYCINIVICVTVVICLKNRTFAVSQTTVYWYIENNKLLWFAWKIVLLQYRKQRWPLASYAWEGCDLLEKSYFCSIANNSWGTTKGCTSLWFAWKIVLLQYRKQLDNKTFYHWMGCDLLEKSYFCSIANNR